jgi:hypothetical protein
MTKFKISILTLLTIFVTSSIFISCSNEDDNIEQSVNKDLSSLYKTSSIFSTISYKEDFSFYLKDNSTKKEVQLDLDSSKKLLTVSNNKNLKGSDEITVIIDDADFITLSNFEKNEQNISYKMSFQDGQVIDYVFETNEDISLDDFKSDITGDFSFENVNISTQKAQCPICVVFIAGAVISAANDHCNEVIEQGTANCSTGCYTVGFCSVECTQCDD